ncbi:MAG: trimethylamine methyltransferase family protein, partial [Deltaproteobacteria bacterium]|nr:trimethylamine methyltransferase family protein [Deltaproteobacteria bacterium]
MNLQRPFRRLTDEDCQKLHEAGCRILERTGVRLHHPPAVRLLEEAGARVSEENRVRIPPDLVERALETAPSTVTLYDRKGEPVLEAGGFRSFFGTGSDCLNVLDHRTGKRRRAGIRDVIEGVTLCDALENVDFVMSMFLPSDVPRMVADRFEMQAMLEHTTKPLVFVTTDLAGCEDAVAMAGAVAGGEDALRERPLAACYINVTNGLQHNREALEKLLFLSSRNLPATYVPVSLGGASAPITLAGGMALWNAGCLAGLVIGQLNRPGSPFITTGWGASALDMRTGLSPYVEPEKQFMAQDLAHFYNLPMFAFGGISDAKQVDGQAGAEAALTLLANAQAGSHLVHDMGYLESGLTGSLAQLVVCDELVSWVRSALAPVEITEETLALDVIDEIGPDGQHLDSLHTLRHYRDRWYPQILDRQGYETWAARGGRDLGRVAAERAEALLKEHRPEPLAGEIRKR